MLLILALTGWLLAAPPLERPWEFGEQPFRVAILPDTQHYTETWPDHLQRQTEWLAQQALLKKNPMIAALNLGDITNNNALPEWEQANRAYSRLDGILPYALTVGNHDLSPGGHATDRTTSFHDFFPPRRFSRLLETFEPGFSENSIHRFFSPAGTPLLVVMLEFGPRNEVLNWARQAIARHGPSPTLIATHDYLYTDGERSTPANPYHPRWYGVGREPNYANDGKEIWEKLVSRTPSVFMVVNGHHLESGVARRLDRNLSGLAVYQMLSNYQNQGQGGDGYLRVLHFDPGKRLIQVRTYSPSTQREKTEDSQHFNIEWKNSRYQQSSR